MSKARDNMKRLKRAAYVDGRQRAVVRLAPDSDAWTPEALASGVGKPVRDGQGGPEIGEIDRLWKADDGWIHAEVKISAEHAAKIRGDAPLEVSRA